MESITIYPKNKKQTSLLKSLLEAMNINFDTKEAEKDDTLMSKEEFYAKIDEARKEIEEGKGIEYTPELKKELFKSIL